ncbi:hypothetical protein [Desulfosporosinus youngiae]|uniref:hypothetical protein n=1 Tax=Desulfosporosinus youngiae TaxID=339862 RepID=UPI0003191260|nr:hypothetical protein [Desulfosporosinus youngiae]
MLKAKLMLVTASAGYGKTTDVLKHILIGRKNRHITTKAFPRFISPGEAFVSLEVGIVRI